MVNLSLPPRSTKDGRYIYLNQTTLIDAEGNEVVESLTLPQAYFLASKRRFLWFCAGVGCGKTYVGARYAYKRAITNPTTYGMIAANTYDQLSSATLPPVLAYFDQMGLQYVKHKHPPAKWGLPIRFPRYTNIITVENGAHIFLRSLDNPEPIRGIDVGWIWVDEIASSERTAWDILVGRLRHPESHAHEIRVTGSPDGDNWTWQEFRKAEQFNPLGGSSPYHEVVFMSARDNPFLDKSFIPSLESVYDPLRAAQEIDGRIVVNQSSKIYYNWKRDVHASTTIGYDPTKPLVFCWDFNIGERPMSSIVAQEHVFSNGIRFAQVLDEIVIPFGNTPKVCESFIDRFRGHQSGITIYGDATGETRAATVGRNDYQVIRDYLAPVFPNIMFKVPRANPTEADRRAAVNAMLMNSRGEVRLFVHPKCKELIEDFSALEPDSIGKIGKKDPLRSHTSDALGYFIAKEFSVSKRSMSEVMANWQMR